MWSAVKQIARGTTFYYRHLNFYLAIIIIGGVVSGFGLLFFSEAPQAAVDIPEHLAPREGTLQPRYDVRMTTSGQVTVNGQRLKKAITFEPTNSKFLLVAIRESSEFLDSVTITVHLPKPVDDPSILHPRIYAIHGTGSSNILYPDNKTVQFQVDSIFKGATISTELTFPDGYFSLGLFDQIRENLIRISPSTWLRFGIILPGLSGLFLLYILLLRWIGSLNIRNKHYIERPESLTAPAVVGALYHGRIGRREITATLFDLAQRGYITLFQGAGNDIVFGKGEKLFTSDATNLRAFEIFLMHQIFGDQGSASKTQDIQVHLNQELFSSKIALTIVNIYDATVAEGYFLRSPNSYYLKYRATGVISFFIGLIALVYGSFTLPEPAYVLFLWVGMIAASLLIIAVTPGLPRRTKTGTLALKNWMAFRNYLTDHMPVNRASTSEFFTYLPYAIVLNCEKEWVERWSQQTIVLPSWFSAQTTPYTAEDYAKSIVAVINYLAKNLVTSRPPDLA